MLPFDQRSRDTADMFLAVGFQDEITARLGEIARLTVVSSNAVRRLSGVERMPLADVAGALGVQYLVLGSFQRGANRLRVTVELTRAASGRQVWRRAYDTGGDALEVQSDVAAQVAAAILANLLPGERVALERRVTRSAKAWEHFQRGNYLLGERETQQLRLAIQEYEAALQADAAFVTPRARIAYAHALLRNQGGSLRGLQGESLVAAGLDIANEALRRDSASSDAWVARGYLLHFLHAATAQGARESFERAVRLDPRNADGWQRLGTALSNLRYFEEAQRAHREALRLEPDRPVIYHDMALALVVAGRFAEAAMAADSGLKLRGRPSVAFVWAHAAAGDTSGLRKQVALLESGQVALLGSRQDSSSITLLHARVFLNLSRSDTARARAWLSGAPRRLAAVAGCRRPAGQCVSDTWAHATHGRRLAQPPSPVVSARRSIHASS